MQYQSAENLLKHTLFIVEATSFERHTLWQQTAENSTLKDKYHSLKWEQMHGWLVVVGKLNKRPCCITVTFDKIDGCLIMFYDQCSQVSDSVQTEKWLRKNFKGTYDNGTRYAQTDANNFGHCLSAIKEHNEKKQ